MNKNALDDGIGGFVRTCNSKKTVHCCPVSTECEGLCACVKWICGCERSARCACVCVLQIGTKLTVVTVVYKSMLNNTIIRIEFSSFIFD